MGGSALLAMGVFTALAGTSPTHGPDLMSAGPMTRGQTFTEVAATTTIPGSVLPIENAAPVVKAKEFK